MPNLCKSVSFVLNCLTLLIMEFSCLREYTVSREQDVYEEAPGKSCKLTRGESNIRERLISCFNTMVLEKYKSAFWFLFVLFVSVSRNESPCWFALISL